MTKYLVRIDGKTVLATAFRKRALARVKQTPNAKLVTIPPVR